ncbi:Hypothetical protein A7982_01808 [Minicystis rosea]|nr:Hypothetical protein A7982_01808 [Minicystis rosea]
MLRAAAISLLLATTLLAAACNKHNVPLGGACERGEDCGKNTLTCLKEAGAAQGYCTTSCSIAPPGTKIVAGGQTCEDVGLVCEKAAKEHPFLGPAYCVKKK